MGQYYTPYVEWPDGQKAVVLSHDYHNGLKLMEHSWVGNNFVDAVISLIEDDPARVGWIGDYSESVGCPPDIYSFCYPDGYETEPEYTKPEVEEPYFLDQNNNFIRRGYFINHTKGEYVDMSIYISIAKRDNWGCIVNPFPLLTCVGNGQGGGDYHGHDNVDMIGYWFMDLIEFTLSEPPEHYKNITTDVLFYDE